MGTAASAQAGELVQNASPEELQAYLDAMSPEDRAKLVGAVAPDEAAGAEAAAAEAKPGTDVPEEAKAQGEAELADPGAPFLAEYFKKVQARTADLLGDQEKLLALAVDPEAKKKLSEESKAWFAAEAKPLLEKSFKHHDINGTDLLEKKEAYLFFKHMVATETDFAKAISALSIEAGVKMSMGMLDSLSEEQREKIKPHLEEQMKKKIETAHAEVQKKEDNYKANKEELDVAAFKVLDVNGDGTLQLAEFIAAFQPETTKNLELHMALGFVSQAEVDEQKKREEEAAEQAGGCAQQ